MTFTYQASSSIVYFLSPYPSIYLSIYSTICCLLQALFDHIPVGVGSRGVIPASAVDLDQALELGRRMRRCALHRAVVASACLAFINCGALCVLLLLTPQAWTGPWFAATRGRRTRSTARSRAECCKHSPIKYVRELES
jgi:hypothetical protein